MRLSAVDQVRLEALGLFDAQWYQERYPDVTAGDLSPYEHFLQYGVFLGRPPGPGFEPSTYVDANEDVKFSDKPPLLHYLQQGMFEGREGVPVWVRERASDLVSSGEAGYHQNALSANSTVPASRITTADVTSGKERESNEDVPGGRQKLAFGKKVDSVDYLFGKTLSRSHAAGALLSRLKREKQNKRQSTTGTGLVHHDKKSSRKIIASVPRKWRREAKLVVKSGYFDWDWYLAEYADVAASNVNPLLHYLRHGGDEMRDPGPEFDTAHYLAQDPAIRRSALTPLVHYLRDGKHKGFTPRPMRAYVRWWETLTKSANLSFDSLAALQRIKLQPEQPTIIIPVFNAVNELRLCLESLEHATYLQCRVILIDDASSDPQVANLLDEYSERRPFECYRNSQNLGFTGTVNRGLELAGRSDVVILNSDTCVTPGWLRRLRLAAYSEPKIGTVTPLSNNAGVFSVPETGSNELPTALSLESVARSLSQSSSHSYPRVPTGNGFCLYVRRDCLDDVGVLDAVAFPRGYGEENDFCMRAGQCGWHHIIDDATYIYHVRSASFGPEKDELIEAGRRVVDSRYPEYSSQVARTFSGEPILEVRRRAGDAMRAAENHGDVKSRILYVISTRTGGTPQTNRDLMGALESEAECLVLRCNSRVVSLDLHAEGIETPLERHVLERPLEAFPHRSEEYDRVVASWLIRYDIELMHIRHIAWHGLGLVDVAKSLGLNVVLSFHDFYTVCPSVKLLDAEQRFCGGRCTSGSNECQHELWPRGSLPPLKHRAIHTWQREFGDLLEKCDAFVTTTPSARDYLCQIYPLLKQRDFRVIPHGRDFTEMQDLASPPTDGSPMRVVFPGNISLAKGGHIIQALAERAPELGVEIHLLGRVAGDVELPDWVVRHGGYQRDEFAQLIGEIRPHVGGVLSIWPETYCHTLTELWAAGVPVVGIDIGAVGDRLRSNGAGWLATSMTLEDVLHRLNSARDASEWWRAHEAVLGWQRHEGISLTTLTMSHRYRELYHELLDNRWRYPKEEVAIIQRSAVK